MHQYDEGMDEYPLEVTWLSNVLICWRSCAHPVPVAIETVQDKQKKD